VPTASRAAAVGSRAFTDHSFYDDSVQAYAKNDLDKVSLNRMLVFGSHTTDKKLIESANYVRKELCTRFSQRLTDLQVLPYIVVTNPHIREIYELYMDIFQRVRKWPEIKTMHDENEFTQMLDGMVGSSTKVLDLLQRGIVEARNKVAGQLEDEYLHKFLDSMISSRIGRRVLTEQHIALHREREGYVGVICRELRPAQSVRKAANEAILMCEQTYGVAPKVHVHEPVKGVKFPYIPHHLDYILLEVLKNSVRATVEHRLKKHGFVDDDDQLPPVDVIVVKGDKYVTIKVSDQGGGVPLEIQKSIFHYGFTTVDPEVITGGHNSAVGSLGAAGRTDPDHKPLAGLGFGLPISRLYAQHFGGNIELKSLDGYGCDMYVQLECTGGEYEKEK